MLQIPAYYDSINLVNAQCSPSTVHISNTNLTAFFRRYLLQRVFSVFEWDIPEEWPLDYILYNLYCIGYFAIVKTDKFGVIPQRCGLSGFDVFYRPRQAIIANPLISKTLDPVIGQTCTLIKIKSDYTGVMDLVCYYADMLALCAETAGVNLFNSHVSYVFAADGKASAESFKKLYDKVASGEPCVVQDRHLLRADGNPSWTTFTQNVKENYIANQILQDMATLRDQFDTEIGIPNANTDKRERMIVDEVNANNVGTTCAASLWLDSLQKGCKEANEMFGIDIGVKWRYTPIVEGGEENDGEYVNSRSVQMEP